MLAGFATNPPGCAVTAEIPGWELFLPTGRARRIQQYGLFFADWPPQTPSEWENHYTEYDVVAVPVVAHASGLKQHNQKYRGKPLQKPALSHPHINRGRHHRLAYDRLQQTSAPSQPRAPL